MTRAAAVVALAIAIAACGGAPTFSRGDLPRLVLQENEAPEGTKLVDEDSGYQTLEEYAETEQKRKRFAAAGFETSYFALFVDPAFFRSGLTGSGSIVVSFGMIFRSEEGAQDGLLAVKEAVRSEGENIDSVPAGNLGDRAFGLSGILEPTQLNRPSGFLFAWQIGNGVFGALAVGPEGTIGEPAVKQLAEIMDARTTPR